MKNILSETTLMPLSLIVLILGGVIGGAAWMTKVEALANTTSVDLKDYKSERRLVDDKLENKIDKLNEKLDRLLELQKTR